MYGSSVGVVRFSAGLVASTVSRCPMVAERLVDSTHDEWAADDDPTVNGILRGYRNARDTSADLVRRHAWHYQITGDAFQTVEQTDAGIGWHIYSTLAVEVKSGEGQPVLVRDVPGGTVANGGAREVPQTQVTRFWVADDDYPLLATSPMIAILDDCERYVILGRRTKREAKSALGLNGILFTPESAHHYPKDAEGKTALYSQMDQDLAAIAGKAWDDDDAMAAIAPYSVHYGVDKETAVKPEWVEVGRTLDPKILEARREALECIVRGLPIPNVIGIEGASGATANHWNGWLIEESFFKTSIAPVADPIFHSDLTTSMLRPMLRQLATTGQWNGDPDEWRVGYDPTDVIVHPDKAGRAVELYSVGALGPAALLRDTGFDESDAPTAEELAVMLRWRQLSSPFALSQQAKGQAVPAPVDDAMTVEAPPVAAMAALAPYPSEVDAWLDA